MRVLRRIHWWRLLRRIPWWGWIIAVLALIYLFGETRVSVGNVSVGGKNLGGFEYDSRRPAGQQ